MMLYGYVELENGENIELNGDNDSSNKLLKTWNEQNKIVSLSDGSLDDEECSVFCENSGEVFDIPESFNNYLSNLNK